MLWENLREEEFQEAVKTSGKVCVIPIGCSEKHGQHLPVGTDTQTCYAIARAAAEIEPVVVFPPLYFGDIQGHTVWRGGIMLSAELLLKLLSEICEEVARNGFKKILFLNGHGGNNTLLKYLERSTLHTPKDYVVFYRNDYVYQVEHLVADLDAGEEFPELTEEDKANLREFVYGKKLSGHGCINETSILLAINPVSCDMSRADAESGLSVHRSDYLKETGIPGGSSRFWGLDHPNSYDGECVTLASANIGRVLIRKRAEIQAEACRLLKMDDRILEWNEDWIRRSQW